MRELQERITYPRARSYPGTTSRDVSIVDRRRVGLRSSGFDVPRTFVQLDVLRFLEVAKLVRNRPIHFTFDAVFDRTHKRKRGMAKDAVEISSNLDAS
jgi:hypothetical protein